MTWQITRRGLLAGSAVTAASLVAAPNILRGAEPVRVGSLTPNTGGGGTFGPQIAAAHRKVVDMINEQGGVFGRDVVLTQEDSETNPETATRAARKLVDADQVIGVIGTFSSSVTLGIMPLCQGAGVLQMCTSSASEIPQEDEKNLVFDFQPLSPAWGKAIASLVVGRGYEEFAIMALNNDFTKSMVDSFVRQVRQRGGRIVNEPFNYNEGQSSYRSEVTQLLQSDPEAVFIPAYVPDFTSIYKEIFRQGYRGQVVTVSIATAGKFKESLGDAADGVLHGFPVPPLDSDAYKAYLRFVGLEPTGDVQHPFGCAGFDQINTLLLAVESAQSLETQKVRDHLFEIANPAGVRVTNLPDGLEALRAGEKINYSGASSDVDFQPDGMIKSRDFMLYAIREGQDEAVRRITSEAG